MTTENNGENGLKRRIGLFPLTSIVVASSMGTGIFMIFGNLMGILKNPLIIIVFWIVGGIIALCGALSYGELGATMPRAGGEYVFLSELYHPLVGFLSGWLSLFGFSASIAAIALAFPAYFAYFLPSLLGGAAGKVIFSLLIILIFVFIHSTQFEGIKFGSRVQSGLALFTVVVIVSLLVLAGFIIMKGNWRNFLGVGGIHFDFSRWTDIGLALMSIMFCYTGWNASTYIGSEVKDPKRNIPRSLLLGTGIVILLYLGLNIFYVLAVPPANMTEPNIFHSALAAVFGPSSRRIITVVISSVLISSLSTFFILGPRIYYAMARNQVFFKFASEISPRFEVPSKSIVLQAVIAAIMIVFGSFEDILTYMSCCLLIIPILAVFGVLKLRREKKSVVRLPGYPVAQLFYIWTSVFILCLVFFERPYASSIALLTIMAGIPLYIYFKHFSHVRVFSMKGRLNRAGYFWIGLAISVVIYAICFLFGLKTVTGGRLLLRGILIFFVFVGGMIISAFQVVKRLHDLGRPGSHYWLLFMPFYNIYLGLVLLFKKGMSGDNEYGPNPLADSRPLSLKGRHPMKGRLSRAGYFWIVLAISSFSYIIPPTAWTLTKTLSSGEAIVANLLGVLALIGAAIAIAFQVVKRLHDLGRPGFHYWLLFIPFYNIYLSLVLLFKKGTKGDNAYGSDPLARASC